jgi:hypothetical protein
MNLDPAKVRPSQFSWARLSLQQSDSASRFAPKSITDNATQEAFRLLAQRLPTRQQICCSLRGSKGRTILEGGPTSRKFPLPLNQILLHNQILPRQAARYLPA